MSTDPTIEQVTLRVNGRSSTHDVSADMTLVDLLRDRLRLYGCRETCGIGVCGSCTVMVDGKAVCACLTPAFVLDDADVVTVEGLAGAELHPAQQAFVSEQALQCGFCTSGFLMSTVAATVDQAVRTEDGAVDFDAALEGHMCRCGCYREIRAATQALAAHSEQLAG